MKTFGDLAIGERFDWADGPRGGPITKVDDAHYEFPIHGGRAPDGQWPSGTPMIARGVAEPQYRVRRIRQKDLEAR